MAKTPRPLRSGDRIPASYAGRAVLQGADVGEGNAGIGEVGNALSSGGRLLKLPPS
jgi:hypothetical protein